MNIIKAHYTCTKCRNEAHYFVQLIYKMCFKKQSFPKANLSREEKPKNLFANVPAALAPSTDQKGYGNTESRCEGSNMADFFSSGLVNKTHLNSRLFSLHPCIRTAKWGMMLVGNQSLGCQDRLGLMP